MTRPELRDVEQRMLMARPWDAADDGSVWAITGASPSEKYQFTDCVAFAAVEPAAAGVTVDPPVFLLPSIAGTELVPAAWITRARPLLLVHRDDPAEPWHEHDRPLLRGRA